MPIQDKIFLSLFFLWSVLITVLWISAYRRIRLATTQSPAVPIPLTRAPAQIETIRVIVEKYPDALGNHVNDYLISMIGVVYTQAIRSGWDQSQFVAIVNEVVKEGPIRLTNEGIVGCLGIYSHLIADHHAIWLDEAIDNTIKGAPNFIRQEQDKT